MLASLSSYEVLHCITESSVGRDIEEGQREEDGQEGQGEGEALLMHVRTAEDKVKDIKYIKSLSARAVARKSAAIKVIAVRLRQLCAHCRSCRSTIFCSIHFIQFTSVLYFSLPFCTIQHASAHLPIHPPVPVSVPLSAPTPVPVHASVPISVHVSLPVPVPVCVSESVYAGPRERKKRIAAHTDAAKEAEVEAARPDTAHARSKEQTQRIMSCLVLTHRISIVSGSPIQSSDYSAVLSHLYTLPFSIFKLSLIHTQSGPTSPRNSPY